MKVIGYAGTFDLVTNGHLLVIAEGRMIADNVEVYLNENSAKKTKFPAHVRKTVLEQSIAELGWDNVKVIELFNEYTAVTAKERGVDYLIRGIRNTEDFDYENLIQQTNTDILDGAKTIFVMPPRDLASVSSSFVKMMQGPLGWHWNIQRFLPRPAYNTWLLDYLKTEWDKVFTDDTLSTYPVFEQLCGINGYRAPARMYHNLGHLVHGIDELKRWAHHTGASPDDVRVLTAAFFFHDAVYGADGDATDEESSAILWLSAAACHASFTPQQVKAVADLIRATDHFQENSINQSLKDVLLGADLSILGQAYEAVYKPYSEAIRKEYAHVADTAYLAGRCAALSKLITKAESNILFKDAYFANRYNRTALHNMTVERAALQSASTE